MCRLGRRVSLVTVMGEDAYAEMIREHCRNLGIGLECSLTDPLGRTSTYLCLNEGNGDLHAAVADMDVGQILDVHLMPSEAYGDVDPSAIFSVEIARVPGAESVSVGQQVYLQDQYGRPFPVRIAAKDETTITFDANHEMAGKELNFHIELVEVLEQ